MNITNETGVMAQDPKKNKMLIRILSALVMLPAAIFIILQGGVLLFALVSIFTTIILYEWNGICEETAFSPLFLAQVISSLSVLFMIEISSPYLIYSFIIGIVLIVLISTLTKSTLKWSVLGYLYALVPSASFLILHQHAGGLVVLWMMIVIWAMDTGAYFAGKNIGGPKMSPKISPNKTWAGLIGGTITAMVLGYMFVKYTGAQSALFDDVIVLVVLSGAFAILSQMGDLAESAIKRKFSVKDSGAIIPGHGGIMDRVDGLLFVAPSILIVTNFI
ncbi:phosphatidate cytidylyltransferase [Pseudemcibacter aquimaris]|uniref:phosphatidate cytidylyltransferase n=1 Tax=Pseudemcibacter aquimaris TaxID=2857064 RepID=UPI0020117A02|nr:phosphatidate cytidylyltransferase [Pseudemcibacter aquimaris]MCC3860886.1 phosphatidate cytidylyltransferase [Pseudemcibacter aquimaris]WDU59704.1 phosphatidate cytidylyltransferase [Pseudemcibacter aquimaris]